MDITVNKNRQVTALICMAILLAMISWTAFYNPTIPLLSFAGLTLIITGTYFYSISAFNRSGKAAVHLSTDQLTIHKGTLKGLSIYWSEIKHIEEKETPCNDEKVLLLFLSDPNTYIEKAKGIQRRRMYRNLKAYGTPIVLSAFELAVSYPELKDSIFKTLNDRI